MRTKQAEHTPGDLRALRRAFELQAQIAERAEREITGWNRERTSLVLGAPRFGVCAHNTRNRTQKSERPIVKTESEILTVPFDPRYVLPLTLDFPHLRQPDGRARVTCAYDQQGLRRGIEQDKAFASFLCRACNAHDALVKALRLIEQSESFNGGTRPGELQQIARAALKLAGKEGE